MVCGPGHRHGPDPVLLWLWLWLAATAPIGPLAWEPPYASAAALSKRPKKKKKFKMRNSSILIETTPLKQKNT